MLVGHVLDNGHEKVQTNKSETRSFTRSIEIFRKEQMETQIRMPL